MNVNLRKYREPLIHCAVFIELKARDKDALLIELNEFEVIKYSK